MKLNIIMICLSLLLLPVAALANTIACPAYHTHPANKLLRVSVFDVIDKNIYELAPAEDHVKGHIVKQYWDGFTYKPGTKTYFTCSYMGTTRKVTLMLSADIKICRFTFPYPDTEKSKIPARFYCSSK